jgi:hypothetical protein
MRTRRMGGRMRRRTTEIHKLLPLLGSAPSRLLSSSYFLDQLNS